MSLKDKVNNFLVDVVLVSGMGAWLGCFVGTFTGAPHYYKVRLPAEAKVRTQMHRLEDQQDPKYKLLEERLEEIKNEDIDQRVRKTGYGALIGVSLANLLLYAAKLRGKSGRGIENESN